MPPRASKSLNSLAGLYGIESVFTDELGRRQTVSVDNLRTVLSLLGAPTGPPAQIRHTAAHASVSAWLTLLPASMVVQHHAVPRVWHIHLPLGKRALSDMKLTWSIDYESRKKSAHYALSRPRIEASKTIRGRRYVRVTLPFPQDILPGYHRLHVDVRLGDRHWQQSTRLIVVPAQCYLPPQWKTKTSTSKNTSERWWGLTVQLYGLRSRRNWGIGDFRDLKKIMQWAGQLGAVMVGVNPLHALLPGEISPYSPSSRLFHQPLYLDLEGIPEYVDPSIQRFVQTSRFQRTLVTLRQSLTVDYAAVHRLKWPLLRKLYRVFVKTHVNGQTKRGGAFLEFIEKQGLPLERFAQFQVLQERFTPHGQPGGSWRNWPAMYRHPDSPAVRDYLQRHQQRIDFYRYVEWQCDEQIAAVQSASRRAGMPIGLYTDFAIGIDPHGADAWMFQDDFAAGASVGAPPDLFSPKGQNWGLAPPHPSKVEQSGYRLFEEGFRRNMRHSGLFRLDHAMGLFRLFWVPQNKSAAEGAFVRYPSQDLLGILALESHRQKVIVVGEDLGTVTPEIRRQLMQGGLLSYRLLLFEKSGDGKFIPSGRYPAQAMTAVTTHDLPTLRGFWSGRDIELKERFGLYPDPKLIVRDNDVRRRDRQGLLDTLHEFGVIPRDYPRDADKVPTMDDTLRSAIYTFLARTPSYLLALPLEDLLDDCDTPNLPGASGDLYPVWRIKAGPSGSTLESWPRLRSARLLGQVLSRERPFRTRRSRR
jgi:4-alpha-glucanotransferase